MERVSDMKLINKKRATGKSTQLIHTADVTGMPIIIKHEPKKYLEDLAKRLGCDVKIYSYEEWKRTPHDPNTKVLVDECEELMKQALEEKLQAKVVAGTLTLPLRECPVCYTDKIIDKIFEVGLPYTMNIGETEKMLGKEE